MLRLNILLLSNTDTANILVVLYAMTTKEFTLLYLTKLCIYIYISGVKCEIFSDMTVSFLCVYTVYCITLKWTFTCFSYDLIWNTYVFHKKESHDKSLKLCKHSDFTELQVLDCWLVAACICFILNLLKFFVFLFVDKQ